MCGNFGSLFKDFEIEVLELKKVPNLSTIIMWHRLRLVISTDYTAHIPKNSMVHKYQSM